MAKPAGVSSITTNKIGIALLGLLLLMGAALAYECVAGGTGTVAWYTQNTTGFLTDVCGNQVGATNNSAYTGAAGQFDTAGDYESGDSSYVDLNFGAVDDTILGNFTSHAWIRAESWGVDNTPFGQVDAGGSSLSMSFLHRTESTNNSLWCQICDDLGACTNAYSSTGLGLGVYYFTACMRNDTHLCAYLYNATTDEMSCTGAPVLPNSTNDPNFTIGRPGELANRYWDGRIDEVGIHNFTFTRTQLDNVRQYNNLTGLVGGGNNNYGIISNTFTTPVYETNDTLFNYSMWYNSTNITSVDAWLYYNFTQFSPTSTGNSSSGDNVTIWWAYDNFTLPLVQTNYTNISTWWRYNITWAINATIHTLNATNNTQSIYHAYYWDDYYPDLNVLWGQTLNIYGNITDLVSRATYNLWADFNSTDLTLVGSANPYTNVTTAPEPSGNNESWVSNATLNVTYTSPDYGGSRTYERISENETITSHRLQLANCSGWINTTVLNYTCYNETAVASRSLCDLDTTFWVYPDAAQAGLNSTYSDNQTGADSYIFCIYPSWATAYVNSWQGYENTTWSSYRAYFLDNATVTNTTSYVSLYLLDAADDILTSVTLNDQYSTPYEDAYLYFNRYYVEENQYRTVAMCLTDDDGGCNTYLEPNDVWYRIQVIKDHEVQYTFSPQTLSCDPADQICSLTITMTESGSYGEYFDYWDNVAYSCAFSNVTNITSCTITDTSGLMQYSRLLVYQVGLFAPILECDTNSSAASATLTCTHTNPSGDYQYYLVAHFYDEDILTDGTFSVGSPSTYGEAGVFGTIILVVALSFIGLWSAPVAILLAFIGLLISYALQMFWISLSSLVAIGVVAVLLIYKTR